MTDILKRLQEWHDDDGELGDLACDASEEIVNLRAELATLRAQIKQAEEKKPVAWQWLDTGHFRKNIPDNAERSAWNALVRKEPK